VIYDCLIIGAGLSGLTCGIKCASEGLRTVIISGGMNTLHFSSGSIDIFGYDSKKRAIYSPFEHIKKMKKKDPDHPYSKMSQNIIKESLFFFKEQMSLDQLHLYNNENLNHFHITALGTIKPSFFSQESVYNEKFKKAIETNASIKILNFEGYRDYYAEFTAEQLKRSSLMKDIDISTGNIRLPYYTDTEKNIHEFRSIDIARIFEKEKYLPRIAEEIKNAAGEADIVSLPAFIGIHNYNQIHKKLEEMTGLLIYEVPSLPPSILGMRLDRALKNRFAALGGEYSAGDKITGGIFSRGTLEHVLTENYGTMKHSAKYFVLSTGSYISGGLKSSFNKMEEPVFNLIFDGTDNRSQWYSDNFFDKKSHPFLEYGVKTNKSFNPSDSNGKTVKNLFCAGAILSGYNPVSEGSGGGVAISTGYNAALKIINGCKNKND